MEQFWSLRKRYEDSKGYKQEHRENGAQAVKGRMARDWLFYHKAVCFDDVSACYIKLYSEP